MCSYDVIWSTCTFVIMCVRHITCMGKSTCINSYCWFGPMSASPPNLKLDIFKMPYYTLMYWKTLFIQKCKIKQHETKWKGLDIIFNYFQNKNTMQFGMNGVVTI